MKKVVLNIKNFTEIYLVQYLLFAQQFFSWYKRNKKKLRKRNTNMISPRVSTLKQQQRYFQIKKPRSTCYDFCLLYFVFTKNCFTKYNSYFKYYNISLHVAFGILRGGREYVCRVMGILHPYCVAQIYSININYIHIYIYISFRTI